MSAAVDLYWLPLGAGGSSVRLNGKAYEAITAGIRGRPRQALYHSALEIVLPEGSYAVEMTPDAGEHGDDHGVLATGPVGARFAGGGSGFSVTRSGAGRAERSVT